MTVRRERRYAVDTNLFIRGYRTEADREALEAFLQAFAPFCVLPAIVAQELLAGVRSIAEVRLLEKQLLLGDTCGGRARFDDCQWRSSPRV